MRSAAFGSVRMGIPVDTAHPIPPSRDRSTRSGAAPARSCGLGSGACSASPTWKGRVRSYDQVRRSTEARCPFPRLGEPGRSSSTTKHRTSTRCPCRQAMAHVKHRHVMPGAKTRQSESASRATRSDIGPGHGYMDGSVGTTASAVSWCSGITLLSGGKGRRFEPGGDRTLLLFLWSASGCGPILLGLGGCVAHASTHLARHVDSNRPSGCCMSSAAPRSWSFHLTSEHRSPCTLLSFLVLPKIRPNNDVGRRI